MTVNRGWAASTAQVARTGRECAIAGDPESGSLIHPPV